MGAAGEFLAGLFASGRIADALLALVAAEAVVLALVLRRRALGPGLGAGLAANLAAGAALMLAVRAALTGAPWFVVAICLAAGGAAHAADIALRLRPGRSAAGANTAYQEPPSDMPRSRASVRREPL